MTNARISLLFIFSFSLVFTTGFVQEDPELELRLTRNVGYSSSIASQFRRIQGSFTVRVQGPTSLERVEFYLGEQLLGQESEAPFALRFHTDAYPVGVHQFTAIGYTATGDELYSNIVIAEIVAASESQRDLVFILIPLLAIVIISSAVPILLSRGKKKKSPPAGTQRNYGRSGGGICARCQRPFPFPQFSPTLGPGLILAACPYCGKTGIIRRRAIDELRAAEEAELKDTQRIRSETDSSMNDEEKLRKELDDTRFQ